MPNEVLTTGRICVITYTRSDFVRLGKLIRGVAYDIYNQLPYFKNDIYWIQSVKPNDNFTINDVLLEYVAEHGSNNYIFAQAGTLEALPSYGVTTTVKIAIAEQRNILFDVKFVNPIFNRRMSNSYGNPEVFMYINDETKEFLNENTGKPETGKIINRVVEKK